MNNIIGYENLTEEEIKELSIISFDCKKADINTIFAQMAKAKKIDLYSDEVGFFQANLNNVRFFYEGNDYPIDNEFLWIKREKGNDYPIDNGFLWINPEIGRYRKIVESDFTNLGEFLKLNFFSPKITQSTYGGCSYQKRNELIQRIQGGDTSLLKAIKVNRVELIAKTDDSEEIIFNYPYEHLENKDYYYASSSIINNLKSPRYVDICVGDKYYYNLKGTCEVIEKYELPNLEQKICKVRLPDGKETDEKQVNLNLKILPYASYENEYAIFNRSFNEQQLQAVVQIENGTINVLWQTIQDAALYIVDLYRIIDKPYMGKVYHIASFSVERTKKYFSQSGLLGGDYIVKVSAENRSGEIIAQTRGIANGFPQYFTEIRPGKRIK